MPLPSEARVACMGGTKAQENHNRNHKLSDHVIFWSEGAEDRVGVVELKSKQPSAGKVAEQLQGGASLAEEMIADWPHEVEFVAAVLHKGISAPGIKAIARKKVRFRGKDYRVLAKACGTDLIRLYDQPRPAR